VITQVQQEVNPVTIPNTLLDPDYSLIGGIQNAQGAVGSYTANAQTNQIVPFTAAQQTKWRLFQGQAGQPPTGVSQFIFKGISKPSSQVILTSIIKSVGIRYYCEGVSAYANGGFSAGGIAVTLSPSGTLSLASTDGKIHQVYLDILYISTVPSSQTISNLNVATKGV
jgi:hypothetical protein